MGLKWPRRDQYTGCSIMLLLCVAFIIGGMWGGLAGGGLVLWVLDAAPTPPAAALITTEPTLPTPTPTSTPDQPVTPTPTPVLQPTATPALEDAIAQVLPAVVTVINYQQPRSFGAESRIVGSGVVVDETGYIITNAHVIAQTQHIDILFNTGETISATLVLEHPDLDLAMLKVEAAVIMPAAWGDSSQVRLGQSVVAIGSALGDFPNSVTMGVVSGLNRALAVGDYVMHGLIQTDAAINQGNSGGPLINLDGEIVGINTFMIREDHNQGVAQGISFAIPASSVKALVKLWMDQISAAGETPLNVEVGVSEADTPLTPQTGQ